MREALQRMIEDAEAVLTDEASWALIWMQPIDPVDEELAFVARCSPQLIAAMARVVMAAERRESLRDQWASDDCDTWPSLQEWQQSTDDVRAELTALAAVLERRGE